MFDLERLEKNILIFLAATLLVGAAVMVYKKTFPVGSLRIESRGVPAAFPVRDISKDSKKININKAAAAELMNLDGVGEVLARRIVEYRMKNGPFVSIEDLKRVQGIGDKLFSKIRDSVSSE